MMTFIGGMACMWLLVGFVSFVLAMIEVFQSEDHVWVADDLYMLPIFFILCVVGGPVVMAAFAHDRGERNQVWK